MNIPDRLGFDKEEFINDLNNVLEKYDIPKFLNMVPDQKELARYMYQAFCMFAKIIFQPLDNE